MTTIKISNSSNLNTAGQNRVDVTRTLKRTNKSAFSSLDSWHTDPHHIFIYKLQSEMGGVGEVGGKQDVR